MNNTKHIFAVIGIVTLFMACSSEDLVENTEAPGLTFAIAERGWDGETVSITRSGETLEGLKVVADPASPANGEGFGIYTYLLFLDNNQRQVVWNSTKGKWDMGKDWYWQRKNWGESTFNVYAYAPYSSSAAFEERPNTAYPTVEKVSRYGKLTFTSANDARNVDLLYAGDEVDDNVGVAELTFNHALAKLSFGIITNNTGSNIILKKISVTGSLYSSNELNLMTGEWSDCVAYSPVEKTIERTDFNSETEGDQQLDIAQASFAIIDVDPYLLIPGPTVTITLTLGDDTEYSFNTELEKGKNKIFNITVKKNFEVVIE